LAKRVGLSLISALGKTLLITVTISILATLPTGIKAIAGNHVPETLANMMSNWSVLVWAFVAIFVVNFFVFGIARNKNNKDDEI